MLGYYKQSSEASKKINGEYIWERVEKNKSNQWKLVETAQRKYAYYLGPKKGWAIQDSEVSLKDYST